MIEKIKTKTLVNFLKAKDPDAKFVDKLKIVYRPYICPFDDLLMEIEPGKSVFDVGCGSGQFALLIAEFCKPSKIKGIEISEELIKNARELLKDYSASVQIQFEKYKGDDIPLDIAQYDYVTMVDVGHHIPKKLQEDFFAQLYSKMGKGSTFIYKDINAASPLVLANKMHDLVFAREIGNELSASKTRDIFKNMGFSIERTSKKTMFCYPHFTIIAKKVI